MAAESFTPVFPTDDLDAAVEFWTSVLGVAPTFVDGDRWAQFDLGPRRLALAGSDRMADEPGVMVKVDNLEAARLELAGRGEDVGEIEAGPHERRFLIRTRFCPIVFYSPAPPV
jgi:catechol 2,3-dioxygenase-like lactoylglutathione lyase family enzyme